MLFFLTYHFPSNSQSLYRVYLSNRKLNNYSYSAANSFLSQRAIDRRIKNNVSINIDDLPIASDYIHTIVETCKGKLVCQSKWMNTVVVETSDSIAIAKVLNLPFVRNVTLVKKNVIHQSRKSIAKFETNNWLKSKIDINLYGDGFTQLAIHRGFYLHNNGFTGKNILIAIIDAAFKYVHQFKSLQKVFVENRILAVKDFVYPSIDIFQYGSHGATVLSIIAANDSKTFIGSAPDAQYVLLRSEDITAEYPAEEDFWVAAAEFADSIGVDVINTSLGYTEFDDAFFNYSYADMDGSSTFISLAAQRAAEKGIILVVSAGNEGNKNWRYIGAPADARKILTVGSISSDMNISAFSSIGPTFDGRIKPEIVAMGSNTFAEIDPGVFSVVNGTSFSAPIISGLTACLIQAFSNTPYWKIRYAIISSSSEFYQPDSWYGYGIPNFEKAYQILQRKSTEDMFAAVYPNPFNNKLTLELLNPDKEFYVLSCFNIMGQFIFRMSNNTSLSIDLTNYVSQLTTGMYFFQIKTNYHLYHYKILKIN